jgi:hypothetical protein
MELRSCLTVWAMGSCVLELRDWMDRGQPASGGAGLNNL